MKPSLLKDAKQYSLLIKSNIDRHRASYCVVLIVGVLSLGLIIGAIYQRQAAVAQAIQVIPIPRMLLDDLPDQTVGRIQVTKKLPETEILADHDHTIWKFRLQKLAKDGTPLQTQYQPISFDSGVYTVDEEGYTARTIEFSGLSPGYYQLSQIAEGQDIMGSPVRVSDNAIADNQSVYFYIGIQREQSPIVYTGEAVFESYKRIIPPASQDSSYIKTNC